MKSMGERIKEQRVKMGLSLQELAELSGTTRQNLSLLETKNSNPTIKTLIKLCDVFGVHIDYFLDGQKKDRTYHKVDLKDMRDISFLDHQNLQILTDMLKNTVKTSEDSDSVYAAWMLSHTTGKRAKSFRRLLDELVNKSIETMN